MIGSMNYAGYIIIAFNKRLLRAHRAAWLLTYGRWPVGEIDHINGVRNDNRLSNLRECTIAQNRFNKHGVRGAYKNGKRWVAEIQCTGTRTYLGRFKTEAEALSAYDEAAKSLYGNLFHPEEGRRKLQTA